MPDACVSNGKGTSEPIATNVDIDRSWRSRSARKTMGGMPTPPPRSSAREWPATASNGRPTGPMTFNRAPGAFGGEEPRAVAHFLVQDVDPAGGGVGAHQRHRTPHRKLRVAAHVHEGPRRGVRSDLRRVDAQPPLAGGMRLMGQNLAIFDEDGAAMHLVSYPAVRRTRVARACGPRVYYSGLLLSLAGGMFTEAEWPEAEDDSRRASRAPEA